MEKDKIFILEDRGLISVSGKDAEDFLQNIITNDINKVSKTETLFSAIFTPQGKYLYEFFVIKSADGFYLDCDGEIVNELIDYLEKYRLRSNVEFKDFSSEYVIGVVSGDKFNEIKKLEKKFTQTIWYRNSPCFLDSRSNYLGCRILSSLENLHLTIKKLSLKIGKNEDYIKIAFENGIPIKGLKNLQNNLFGLEANFEQFSAIDFSKGCFIGQENTARMKLKNKLKRKLMAISSDVSVNVGSEISFNNIKIGKVLINNPFTFALINLFNPDLSEFKNKEVLIDKKKAKLIKIN